MEDARTLVQGQAEKRGITMRFTFRSTTIVIDADPRRLTQVLVNILSNAIKYNRSDGHVDVVCSVSTSSAQISITDPGYGISAKNIERLFVPFERLGAERTNIEGAGLGLAVSRQLIELMHGSIEVESTQGLGTTFSIKVPLSNS